MSQQRQQQQQPQQQQTWTEWFFGTARATSQAPSISTSDAASQSQPPASDTKSSTSSPYGPFLRTGRGGAGNYTWQSEVDAGTTISKINDVEARNPSDLQEQADAAAQLEQHDTEIALRRREQESEGTQYVRVGRAMVERKDFEASLATEQASRSAAVTPIARSSTTTTGSARPAYRGRGGAGNYAAAQDLTEKQRAQQIEQDSLAAERNREQAVQHVDNTVPAPQGAWLGGQKRSSGHDRS